MMLKHLICLCLAFPASAFADPPRDTSLPAVTKPDGANAQPPSVAPLLSPFPPGLVPPKGAMGGSHKACRKASRAEARLANGTTALQFTITAEGLVHDVVVKQSSGSDALDKAAADCVATWRFTPALNDGRPQAVQWTTNVDWHVH
jgi:protein TonB